MRNISNDVKQFSGALEQIDMLKKCSPTSTTEINSVCDELFTSLNFLCSSLKIKQNQLESIKEFNAAVQEELRYISEMEDIELNRDWSQPKKLKSVELIQHRHVKFYLSLLNSHQNFT